MGIKKIGLLLSVFVFGIFWVNHQTIEKEVSRRPSSAAPVANECDPTALGFGVQNEIRLPANTIYHYGLPEILAKDVKANQIPLQDWKDFVMGEKKKTRFILKPFRRGLYGTDLPEDADKFSSFKYSGLIAIKIKEECLVPTRVSSIIALGTQTRFKEWFEQKERGVSLEEWNNQCFQRNGQPNESQFQFYENHEDGVKEAKPETLCEKLVNEFWIETKIGIVQDTIVTRSWAIRDRNCIEGIEGSAEYWVKVFSNDKKLWENSCDRHVTHHARARVWFNALAEKLDALPAEFQLHEFLKGLRGPEALGASEFNAQDFAPEFDHALARCRSSQKLDEFRQRMKSLARDLDGMMSQEIKALLNETCN